ncbi:MAG: NADH-quinone oxidoreductase subunit A [Dehalococcoidia bacterium]
MLADYGYIGIFLVLATLIPISMLLIPWALTFVGVKPSNPNPVKQQTYESGMQTIGGSWVRFNFRYYFFALLFVIFDVEVVFLFPWAVHLGQLRVFGLVEMGIFILILLLGYAYAWRKKALEWS